MGRLLNFAMFYLGWFACVMGAGHGQLWLGPSVVAALVLIHLLLTAAPVQEARLILMIGVFGFAVDTLQASAGLYSFTRTSAAPWLCPLWMVALWMIFATTLNASMSWLAGRYRLAAVLGAICGPVSYVAGARLGAIELSAHADLSVVGIAVVWACVMPSLLWLRERALPSPVRRAGGVARRLAGTAGLGCSVRLSQAADPGVEEMTHRMASVPRVARVLVGALLIATMAVQSSAAAELEGVHFVDQVRAGDVTMRLSCVGLLRYKLFIKAYVAALYLGDSAANGAVLADVPKRLELSYFWSISGADFGKAGDQILAQNVDAKTFAALRSRLDRINALYRDVKPGDRYSLTYIPGVGTELALNDSPLGVIEGADFGAAYFRIWLGDHAIDVRLRDQLLGCPRRDVEDVHAALPAEHGVP